MIKKVVLVGRPAMGKTTIEKVIFRNEDPNDLLLFPLESTIDIKYSVHNLLDLKISLVDTAGQSLPIYLNNEEKQSELFGDASALIYVFDYNIWLQKSQEIIDDIRAIYHINENNKYGAKIFLFYHKIDLIYQVNAKKLNLLRSKILNQLDLPLELQIYFTSLYPNLIHSTYNAFFDIISNFSAETSNLKEIVNGAIKGLTKVICFVTNQDNHIVSQVMTEDFDISFIHLFHEKVHLLSQSPEESITRIIELNSKFYYAIIDDISKFSSKHQKVIIISEMQKIKRDYEEKLRELSDMLKQNLKNHFNKNIQQEVT